MKNKFKILSIKGEGTLIRGINNSIKKLKSWDLKQ